MKKFTILVLVAFYFPAKAQKNELDIKPDTATSTKIQKALLSKGLTVKKEFIKVDDVKDLQFQILVVTDLSDGRKTKGLYLDNQSYTAWTSRSKTSRYAYLDEDELDNLITFLESCDKKWKNEKPLSHTEYVYTTNDNLRISFWSDYGNKWNYSVQFISFIYDREVNLSKKFSDELVGALKKIKQQMAPL